MLGWLRLYEHRDQHAVEAPVEREPGDGEDGHDENDEDDEDDENDKDDDNMALTDASLFDQLD
jgi:hypothetical protein